MCEVRSKKNGQEQKKNTVVSSKKKSTVMNPIRCQMKKRNPSSGQNGQLVHWWLLIHFGQKEQSKRCARMVLRFVCAVEAIDYYSS